MIRRLLYHFFWNFYDYLGSYLLLGFTAVLALLVATLVGGSVAALVPVVAAKAVISGVTLLLLLGIALWFTSGIYAFAARAARQDPARLPDFVTGTRLFFRIYLKLGVSALLVLGICISNIWFYQRMAAAPDISPSMRTVLIIASVMFVWICMGFCLFLFCTSAVPARFAEESTVKAVVRRGAMLLALAPGMWTFGALLYLFLALLCALSLVGSIFLLPLLAVITTTALEIAVRLVEDLRASREELGEGRSLREYKKRALELGWEWEYRQPRRTLRELIRPWE